MNREYFALLLADPQQSAQTMLLQTGVGAVTDRGGIIQGHGLGQYLLGGIVTDGANQPFDFQQAAQIHAQAVYAHRQQHARRALQGLLDLPDLVSDVREVVSRALAAS